MRSTIIAAAAAFAVSAVAVPFAEPEVVTAYATNVVYQTNVVTVTEGAAPAATTVAAADAAPSQAQGGSGWSGWHWPHGHQSSKKHKTKTRTRTRAPSPPPSTPTSTWEQPAPTYEPAPTSAAPEPSSEAPAPTDVSGYNAIVVAHHNVHRSNHSAPDLEWDSGLEATAASIASNCIYAHNTTAGGGGYGQNIAAGVEAANVSAIITDLFYNGEVGYYDGMYGMPDPDMTNFELWGHFSQIVWKGTQKVGCATHYCPNGLANTAGNVLPYFTVCNYSPPGNYGGEYADNVKAPSDQPTVNWNYGL